MNCKHQLHQPEFAQFSILLPYLVTLVKLASTLVLIGLRLNRFDRLDFQRGLLKQIKIRINQRGLMAGP